MARQEDKKLNLFVSQLPSGVLFPSSWLHQHGVSSKLIWWYVKSGWLRQLAKTAYCRTDTKVDGSGVVFGLQQYANLPLHISGITALELLGRAHYLPVDGIKTIYLFAHNRCKALPGWLSKDNEWEEQFIINKTNLFTGENKLGVVSQKFDSLDIFLSSPERAILEVMHLVPQQHTYEQAYLLMENLHNLRPNVAQKLLESCRSIKAKRLFLHCADSNQHPWLDEIDAENIELGSGKRIIGEGGVYHPKFRLSLPLLKSQ